MDNLQLIKDDVEIYIDPNGAPGSILAEKNQLIFNSILEKVGKYTGSPFVAKRNLTLFSPGDFSWNGNAMNNETEFIISISKFTTDLNDVGLILDTLISQDLIQFKDFKGRSVFLKYFGHREETDGNGAIYYDIVVVGFSNNLNYTYQINESEIAVISFHKKINEFSDAPSDGEIYGRKNGDWILIESKPKQVFLFQSSATVILPADQKNLHQSRFTAGSSVFSTLGLSLGSGVPEPSGVLDLNYLSDVGVPNITPNYISKVVNVTLSYSRNVSESGANTNIKIRLISDSKYKTDIQLICEHVITSNTLLANFEGKVNIPILTHLPLNKHSNLKWTARSNNGVAQQFNIFRLSVEIEKI